MIPPTLEEHRAWVEAHGRNYTDHPIKRRVPTLHTEPAGVTPLDAVTQLIEGREAG